MDATAGLDSLFWIVLAAASAPVLAGLIPRRRVPEVVITLVLGVLIGPHVLHLASIGPAIALFQNVGLGFLFFVAGFEIDSRLLRGSSGRQAITTWLVSLVLALAVSGLLTATGIVHAFLPVAIALTSTTVGTLLPILRDSDLLARPLGRVVVANGAVGELGPILAISLFLGSTGAWGSLITLAAFAVVAVVVAYLPARLTDHAVGRVIQGGADASSQTTVRWTVVLLVFLLALAARFGLDIVLGAFAAGLVLRRLVPDGDERLETKIDALAFGFFVPLFFVTSGMGIDIGLIADAPARLVMFFVLIVLVRGVPAWLATRRLLPSTESLQAALYIATGLPIIVAVTAIGLETGVMLPANAAALVGAGTLSVLVFPLLANVLAGREPATDAATVDDRAYD